MTQRAERKTWISYLRVSTSEQADKELSLPAQRHAVNDYATRHSAFIEREYVEAGASGTNPHRPVFRAMLEDVLRPGSDVATILVHHSSRFTRDATEARIVKSRLQRLGVRVLSVSQEIAEGPMGKLMEGLFECIDQYESELNGVRTSAAMSEAVRQGFFPGARPPYGFRTRAVEVRPGVARHTLEVDPTQAEIVREIFRLYIVLGGAKAVARALNQRGLRYRTGIPWNNKLVLGVIEQPAATGTYLWGKQRGDRARPKEEWLSLSVDRIIDQETFELARRLRSQRDPKSTPGKASSKPHLLSGLVKCGLCGASYQLETSGKRIDGAVYRYCYYNCRNAVRAGREVCRGFRIATDVLDAAVLARVAQIAPTAERVERMRKFVKTAATAERIRALWQTLITADPQIGRTYLVHIVDRVEVRREGIRVLLRVPEPASCDTKRHPAETGSAPRR